MSELVECLQMLHVFSLNVDSILSFISCSTVCMDVRLTEKRTDILGRRAAGGVATLPAAFLLTVRTWKWLYLLISAHGPF